MLKKISVMFFAVAIGAISVFAQDGQVRNLVSGQKYTIEGVVVSKESESTFVVRDSVGVDTRVTIAPNASIKNNATFGGDRYPVSSMVRGLNVKMEGRGDTAEA